MQRLFSPRVPVVAVAAMLALSACGRDYDTGSSASTTPPPVVVETQGQGPYNGVELQQPIAKPDVGLVDTTGAPFNLARDTTGKYVLVYAGYTHCPDVCPTTMSDISVALRGLTPQERDQVEVVMFSTDPQRDTPERFRAFLDQFDPSFTGVLGPEEELIGAINEMGIDVQPPVVKDDGSVEVEHGAQVLAFSPKDDAAHLLWTSGTTPSELRSDLLALMASGQ